MDKRNYSLTHSTIFTKISKLLKIPGIFLIIISEHSPLISKSSSVIDFLTTFIPWWHCASCVKFKTPFSSKRGAYEFSLYPSHAAANCGSLKKHPLISWHVAR